MGLPLRIRQLLKAPRLPLMLTRNLHHPLFRVRLRCARIPLIASPLHLWSHLPLQRDIRSHTSYSLLNMRATRSLPNQSPPKPPLLRPLLHHRRPHHRPLRQKMISSRSIFTRLLCLRHLHSKKMLSKIFFHSSRRPLRNLHGHKHQSPNSSLRHFRHSAMQLPLPRPLRLGMSATIGTVLSHPRNRMYGALLLLPNNRLYLPPEVIFGEGPLVILRVPVLVSSGRRRRHTLIRRRTCSGISGVASSRYRATSVCTVDDTT